MSTIALFCSKNENIQAATALSLSLQIPLVSEINDYDYALILTPDDHLVLQKIGSKTMPLRVDFTSPQIQFRQQRASLKNEHIAKALGLKKQLNPFIVDATGGLARDSFILATLGFKVTLLERSPIIHALIADGIARAKLAMSTSSNPTFIELTRAVNHLTLIHANAITWLLERKKEEQPDIIYLDPMFNERKNSAKPKKEMLIFHDIVGDDDDASALLQAALACAKQRVVVKRPRYAPSLNDISPTYSLKGNSCRFDVYLVT